MKEGGRSSSYGARTPRTAASDGPTLSCAMKRALATLQTWRDRVRQWTERDLHDVGLSWTDIALEVRKPFWRA